MRWRRKRLGTSFFIYMKTSFAYGVCTECAAYSIYCVDNYYHYQFFQIGRLLSNPLETI